MSLHGNFEKAVDPSIVTIPPEVLVTEQLEVYADTDISDLIREASKQLQNRIENYEGTRSGWVISNLVALNTTRSVTCINTPSTTSLDSKHKMRH